MIRDIDLRCGTRFVWYNDIVRGKSPLHLAFWQEKMHCPADDLLGATQNLGAQAPIEATEALLGQVHEIRNCICLNP